MLLSRSVFSMSEAQTNGAPAEVKPTEKKPESLTREDLLFLSLQAERVSSAEERFKTAQLAQEVARLQITAKYKLGEADQVDMGSGLITRK